MFFKCQWTVYFIVRFSAINYIFLNLLLPKSSIFSALTYLTSSMLSSSHQFFQLSIVYSFISSTCISRFFNWFFLMPILNTSAYFCFIISSSSYGYYLFIYLSKDPNNTDFRIFSSGRSCILIPSGVYSSCSGAIWRPSSLGLDFFTWFAGSFHLAGSIQRQVSLSPPPFLLFSVSLHPLSTVWPPFGPRGSPGPGLSGTTWHRKHCRRMEDPIPEPPGHLGLCLVTGLSVFVPHSLGEQPHRNKGFRLWSAVAFYLIPSQRSGEPGPSPHESGGRWSVPIYPDCFGASSLEEPQAQFHSPLHSSVPFLAQVAVFMILPSMCHFNFPVFIQHLPLVGTGGRVWN